MREEGGGGGRLRETLERIASCRIGTGDPDGPDSELTVERRDLDKSAFYAGFEVASLLAADIAREALQSAPQEREEDYRDGN